MTLITNNTTLKKYIPNQFDTVEGEDSLYTKIEPALEIAEKWLEQWVTPLNISQNAIIIELLKKACAFMAFQEAIPSLDLVLTPNGFGIVSNQNVAPASAERITRLIEALIIRKNSCVDLILKQVAAIPEWHSTEPAKFWKQTLFQNLYETKPLQKENAKDEFDEYRILIPEIFEKEQMLGEKLISPELLDHLRTHLTDGSLCRQELQLAHIIRQHVIRMIKYERNGQKCNFARICVQVAGYLKSNIFYFPIWENSSTASQWLDPTFFVNKKENHGYFF